MRLSEHRWLEDHVIQGAILWPGAGFVCLAIEAIKQQLAALKNNTQDLRGYRLRQVEIHQALVVPDDDNGIEVQTVLHSVSDNVIGARGWKEFEILSVTADSRWTQHAKGFIKEHQEWCAGRRHHHWRCPMRYGFPVREQALAAPHNAGFRVDGIIRSTALGWCQRRRRQGAAVHPEALGVGGHAYSRWTRPDLQHQAVACQYPDDAS